jgi:adenylate kinase
LAERTGWPVLGAGKQLRAIAQEDSLVGRKIKAEIDAGMLVPHWFAMYLYLKSLFSVDEGSSVIFDGFNRKIQEAELVVSSLAWLGRSFTVVHVKVSDEEVEKRLSLRKEIENRVDDNAVEERLKEYHEHTERAIELFSKEGVLVEVNGEQTPEAIAADVANALGV